MGLGIINDRNYYQRIIIKCQRIITKVQPKFGEGSGLAGAVKRDGSRARAAIKQIQCLYYTHVPLKLRDDTAGEDEDKIHFRDSQAV